MRLVSERVRRLRAMLSAESIYRDAHYLVDLAGKVPLPTAAATPLRQLGNLLFRAD